MLLPSKDNTRLTNKMFKQYENI